MSKYATIVDVRTSAEYANGHIAGAINVPLDQVSLQIAKLKSLPGPMMVYCRSGNRSGMAVSIMKQHGLTDVVNGGAMDELLAQIKG